MPAEFDFIHWLRNRQRRSDSVPVPAGDDLAVLKWQTNDLLLVGVDQVLDGVHFDSSIHSPREIGRKAMNRNLSDCAAMGCLPAAAVVTLTLPKSVGIDYAKELYVGIEAAGEAFGCPIVGGDTGSWPGKLAVGVTIFGKSDGVPPVTRGGAKPGDRLYVSGALGGSILGRHMTFMPRVETGRRLAESGLATAMIDLSDGLSRDLRHICTESRVGALVDADRIPVHSDAKTLAERDGYSDLHHAMHDGEDYELLVALRVDAGTDALVTWLNLLPIGVLSSEPGIMLRTDDGSTPLDNRAWEHQI